MNIDDKIKNPYPPLTTLRRQKNYVPQRPQQAQQQSDIPMPTFQRQEHIQNTQVGAFRVGIGTQEMLPSYKITRPIQSPNISQIPTEDVIEYNTVSNRAEPQPIIGSHTLSVAVAIADVERVIPLVPAENVTVINNRQPPQRRGFFRFMSRVNFQKFRKRNPN